MLTPYKGRSFDITRPVEVYRNLTRKALSVRQEGLVVAHAQQVMLQQGLFIINEKQRDRARERQVRNVHAYVRGILLPDHFHVNADKFPNVTRITYNPYRFDSFVNMEGRRVDAAPYVYIEADGSMLIHH